MPEFTHVAPLSPNPSTVKQYSLALPHLFPCRVKSDSEADEIEEPSKSVKLTAIHASASSGKSSGKPAKTLTSDSPL